jgi:hypothetical protein
MRRTKEIKIDDPGSRDHGKVFLLTEMSADAAERWATQALYLMTQANGTAATGDGMAALAASGVNFSDVAQLRALQDPSLDSLWDCIRYVHNPKHPPQSILPGDACQIEEIKTRSQLRIEVLKLHLGFSPAGATSTSVPSQAPSA